MSDQAGAGTTTSPLRLLIVSPAQHGQNTPPPYPVFLQQLTGVLPPRDLSTFAGYTSHPPLHIKTKYFKRNVGLWCDELPRTPQPEKQLNVPTTASEATLAEWSQQMLGTTAREVRDVIGGIVVLLPFTEQSLQSLDTQGQIAAWLPYIEATASLRDAIEDESGRDIASVILLQDMTVSPRSSSGKGVTAPNTLRDQMEEDCIGVHGILGFDYILWNAGTGQNSVQDLETQTKVDSNVIEQETLNEYGEKTGFARLREVLAGTDWTADPSTHQLSDDDNNDNDDDAEIEDMFSFTPKDQAGQDVPQILTSKPSLNPNTESESNSFHGSDHAALQREILGLKMAMLDIAHENSTPSSLAGELDVSDLGMRTPLRPSGSVRSGEEEEGQVEGLGALVDRVVAIREAASELEGKEKERFARREVERIMKELG